LVEEIKLKYITNDEIDQIRMQIWNILDRVPRKAAYISDESNVVMVNVAYRSEEDVFECSVDLEQVLTYDQVYRSLQSNLLFLYVVSIVNKSNTDAPQKTWMFNIKFDRRFFFRPLYLPYSDMNNDVIYKDKTKHGLPLYEIAIPDGIAYDVYEEYLKKMIPDYYIVSNTLSSDNRYKILVGSLITIPDEQMDFAAPAGYKFGKGKESIDSEISGIIKDNHIKP